MDVKDFCLKVARTIAADRKKFSEFDAADTRLVPDDHPAIRGWKDHADAAGRMSFRLTHNMLNGFYLTDGIVVSMGR